MTAGFRAIYPKCHLSHNTIEMQQNLFTGIFLINNKRLPVPSGASPQIAHIMAHWQIFDKWSYMVLNLNLEILRTPVVWHVKQSPWAIIKISLLGTFDAVFKKTPLPVKIEVSLAYEFPFIAGRKNQENGTECDGKTDSRSEHDSI